MIPATQGYILFDGINIANVKLSELREKIAVISQHPHLFSGTIRYNIDPFNAFSDTEIWNVLEKLNMASFVRGLSEQLFFLVTRGGTNLSVGQGQVF